jgi:hypothetical protein
MSSSGGVYSTLLPIPEDQVKKINPKVQMKSTLGYTVVGEYFKFGPTEFQARPEDFEFGKMFWELSRELLEKGAVKAHRPAVNKYGEGLDDVLKVCRPSVRARSVVKSWSLSYSCVVNFGCRSIITP